MKIKDIQNLRKDISKKKVCIAILTPSKANNLVAEAIRKWGVSELAHMVDPNWRDDKKIPEVAGHEMVIQIAGVYVFQKTVEKADTEEEEDEDENEEEEEEEKEEEEEESEL